MVQLASVRALQPSLLVRPHPFRTEGPKGYLLRLAETNWMTLRSLAELAVIYEPSVLIGEGLLPDALIDPHLNRIVCEQSHWLINRSRVWNHRFTRFCPHCLSEDAHWRAGWELLFHDACPQHGVWLVDQCSSCGDHVSWQRDHLLRCQCGSDLRTEQVRACPENVKNLSEILLGKLRGSKQSAWPLEKTDLEQTQRLIRYLGTYMSPQAGRNPLKIRQAGSIAASWPITSLAAEILADWPNAFLKSLENIQSEAMPTDARQLGSVFGYAYHYLYRGLRDSAFSPVRQEFENWLSYSWRGGLAKRNRRLALLLLDKATWIPASLARETLGISHQRLQHLIREGALEGETHVSQSGRKFVMVRRDQLDIARQGLDGEIDMKTAGTMLGLTKKRMRQILRLLFPSARKVGMAASTPWSVPRTEVEGLVAIGEKLPRVSIPDEGGISLDHLFRYWAWTSDDIVSLIKAVRDGELMPDSYLDGGVGINGWVLQESVLKAWQAYTIQGFGTWLTVPQMAKLLGIKEQVAYDIVNKHFMHSESVHRQPRGGLRVHRRQVERFKEEYIFSTEIAQRLGISPRKSIAVLADLNVYPISGPGIDGARQVLYLRNEGLEKVVQMLLAKQSERLDLH
jgi:hypothetical protein